MQLASADGLLQGTCWTYLVHFPLLPVTLKQAVAAEYTLQVSTGLMCRACSL